MTESGHPPITDPPASHFPSSTPVTFFMRTILPLAAILCGGLLCCSCKAPEAEARSGDPGGDAPAPPGAEVLAALEGQAVGKKLLGKTMQLVGDQFVEADLRKAPDYYLVHYSASW